MENWSNQPNDTRSCGPSDKTIIGSKNCYSLSRVSVSALFVFELGLFFFGFEIIKLNMARRDIRTGSLQIYDEKMLTRSQSSDPSWQPPGPAGPTASAAPCWSPAPCCQSGRQSSHSLNIALLFWHNTLLALPTSLHYRHHRHQAVVTPVNANTVPVTGNLTQFTWKYYFLFVLFVHQYIRRSHTHALTHRPIHSQATANQYIPRTSTSKWSVSAHYRLICPAW